MKTYQVTMTTAQRAQTIQALEQFRIQAIVSFHANGAEHGFDTESFNAHMQWTDESIAALRAAVATE